MTSIDDWTRAHRPRRAAAPPPVDRAVARLGDLISAIDKNPALEEIRDQCQAIAAAIEERLHAEQEYVAAANARLAADVEGATARAEAAATRVESTSVRVAEAEKRLTSEVAALRAAVDRWEPPSLPANLATDDQVDRVRQDLERRTDTLSREITDRLATVKRELTERLDKVNKKASARTIPGGFGSNPLLPVYDESGALVAQRRGIEVHGATVTDDQTRDRVVIEVEAGGETNLAYTAAPGQGTVTSDTGTDAVLTLADGTNAGLMAPAQHTKLAGVAEGATANSSNATLLARANHTGTQAAATISDFDAAVDARVALLTPRSFVWTYLSPVYASSGTWTLASASAQFLAGSLVSAGVQNSYLEYQAPLSAGTWTIMLAHRQSSDRGIYTVTIDGVSVGTVDGYAAAGANAQSSITGVTVASTGMKAIRLTMATKNGSSSSYVGAVNQLSLVRTA